MVYSSKRESGDTKGLSEALLLLDDYYYRQTMFDLCVTLFNEQRTIEIKKAGMTSNRKARKNPKDGERFSHRFDSLYFFSADDGQTLTRSVFDPCEESKQLTLPGPLLLGTPLKIQ